LLEQKLGQPAHREINPDLCVAMGAAVQGAIIAGSDVGAVLVDITPHSLGIKCLGGEIGPMGRPSEYHFAPIVQRNTPLPASRSEVFRTVADRQPAVDIIVYQGESHDVRDNALAGKFKIEGLAPVPAGNQLVVQFDLNLDGTLRVTAREKATGLVKEITIDNALSRFAREERQAAEQRLEQLWGASDFGTGGDYEGDDDEYDDDEDDDADDQPARTAVLTNPAAEPMPTLAPGPREGQRETVQARALLEKAERLRERATPEDRGELDKLTERIRTAMTDRKWDIVARTSNELSDVLFYLEDA
jgi:molecular chaperone DnaK